MKSEKMPHAIRGGKPAVVERRGARHDAGTPLQVVHVQSSQDAERLVREGFCPIECSFGEVSVVDELLMDHHGSWSHLECVAVRANRDHRGARATDPRFVVAGAADADACFAIYRLAGLGPADLHSLADLIGRVDVDPVGINLLTSHEGLQVLMWNRLGSSRPDALAFHGGVDRWRFLIEGRVPASLSEAIISDEGARRDKAAATPFDHLSDVVAVGTSDVWGFDVWYERVAPVLVMHWPGSGRATIGCRDRATANRLFGPTGLRAVYPRLDPPGWGGRETIGGSPRGARLSEQDVRQAADEVVCACLP